MADCYITMKHGRDFFRDARIKASLKFLVLDDQLFGYKEVRESLTGLRRLDVFVLSSLDATFSDFTAVETLNKSGVFINFTSRKFAAAVLKQALANVLDRTEITEAQLHYSQNAAQHISTQKQQKILAVFGNNINKVGGGCSNSNNKKQKLTVVAG